MGSKHLNEQQCVRHEESLALLKKFMDPRRTAWTAVTSRGLYPGRLNDSCAHVVNLLTRVLRFYLFKCSSDRFPRLHTETKRAISQMQTVVQDFSSLTKV